MAGISIYKAYTDVAAWNPQLLGFIISFALTSPVTPASILVLHLCRMSDLVRQDAPGILEPILIFTMYPIITSGPRITVSGTRRNCLKWGLSIQYFVGRKACAAGAPGTMFEIYSTAFYGWPHNIDFQRHVFLLDLLRTY